MNFWLLARAMSNPPLGLLDVAGQLLELREAVGHQIPDDFQEALLDQPLRAPDEERRGIAGLVSLEVAADQLEHPHRVVAAADLAGHRRPSSVTGFRLAFFFRLGLHPERRVAGPQEALERPNQRREVERSGGAYALGDERLD